MAQSPNLVKSNTGIVRELAAGLRIWLVLMLVIGLFSISPEFRQAFYHLSFIEDLFQQSARIIVLAVGMSFVIFTGGIDLSVGSVAALAGVGLALSLGGASPSWMSFVCAFPISVSIAWIAFNRARSFGAPQRYSVSAGVFVTIELLTGLAMARLTAGGVHVEAAIVICLLVGIACGLMNGLFVALGRVPSFVVTLGMMSAARGLTLFATNGESVPALVPRFMSLGIGAPMVVITLIVVIAGMFVMSKLAAGRYIMSIGGNEQATRLSGVDVIRYKTLAYVASGLCAGIAAILVTAMFGQASTNAATGAELDAIAAVVIGGASLSGGSGTIIGAMVGALTITVITAGLILVHVPDTLQQVVLGAVIVATVVMDQIRRRISSRCTDTVQQ